MGNNSRVDEGGSSPDISSDPGLQQGTSMSSAGIRTPATPVSAETMMLDDPLLSVVNHPASRLPGPSLLHDLVKKPPQENTVPAIAHLSLTGSQELISYAQLHYASDRLAFSITELYKPFRRQETFIIPVLAQGIDLYISLLAILKAGAAFCPLNLDIPPERAKFILDDVAAQIVIATPEFHDRIPYEKGNRTYLVLDPRRSIGTRGDLRHRQPRPTDLAYVMYTSGSTGTPKGVGVSHDAATQSLLSHDRHIPEFSRFLQFAAPTFDVSVFEIFFPLFRGKTLVSCERPIMLNDLPAVINTMEVDACELTPTVARSLLRNRASVPGLRLLLTIGEMLTKPVVDEFGGANERPSILWAMYGPTEATIHCTLQPSFQCSSLVNDIGIPLDSVSAFVLPIADPDSPGQSEFHILPRGQVGELAIGGHQLAQGYLNRPEQTAAAFIDTPYGTLYRTGDKARMHLDGTLECLGRISNAQVKLRGQRIELGEIEHAALRTPGCHGAVAAVVSNILVLFCGGDDPREMESAILESCKQWLPGFMIPGDIVVMKEFPRISSGKVDRKLLIENYTNDQHKPDMDEIRAAQTELEGLLCRIASQVLGTDVTPDQSLLRAGLDSLMVIKFASALRAAGNEVDMVDVLASSTISDLGIRLSEKESDPTLVAAGQAPATQSDSDEAALCQRVLQELQRDGEDVEHILPCTALQTSMLAETVANPTAYCNWVKLELPGAYPASQVRSWFRQVARENETLRSGFVHRKGRFLQVILRQLDASAIHVCDVDCGSRSFSMDGEDDFLRPLRVHISRKPVGGRRSVDIQLHHAIYDGWSMDLIVADLEALAGGAKPDPRPQFRQVSAFYQSSHFERACEGAREFWADTLTGYQPPPLPILCPDLAIKASTRSVRLPIDVPPELVKNLDYGAQTVFQSALAWLWGSLLGCEDVVVGVVASGRTLPVPQIEDVIGPCITSIPIRTDLSQLRSVRDLLASTHTSNRAALPHGLLPLAEIKRMAGVRPGQALYNVLFVYQESLVSRQGGDRLVELVAHQDLLETKLLVEIEPTADGYVCQMTGHSHAFPMAQMKIMAQSIRILANFMVGNPDSALDSIEDAFPDHLLSIYNPNPTSFTGVPDLAHAVERVAKMHPDKDAVCFAHRISDEMITSTSITFSGLNVMANQIARYIQLRAGSRGVSRGDPVAIVMEKSVFLYAGILGILKAGYAYLPLLPTTPSARVEAIFKQAKVKLCLVDATAEVPKINWSCEYLGLDDAKISTYESDNLNIEPDPSRLSYIIFTSGSTGTPKGVCLTQLNIMSNLDALSKIYPVKESSRLLQSCSQAFDVSVFEIFFAWTQAMCLCSGTNDTLFEDLETAIRKLGVTHLSMTPTVASLIDPENVPDVEFLVTAGEAMTEVVANEWGDQLYQGYGPSETTNICSVKKMSPGQQAIQHLGWSFDNTSTLVLGIGGAKPVPLGCFGEFVFGGDQVAQGYLHLPEQTSAKFIDHPSFGRVYRSGDLGRMLPDGSMVISGRVDEQIKIRGQRVELSEITSTLQWVDELADSATLLVKKGSTALPEQIISFVVLRCHPDKLHHTHFQTLKLDDMLKAEIGSLFELLTARLPAYMVPSHIVPISLLPITASGKLDRQRLFEAVEHLDPKYLAMVSPTSDSSKDEGEWSDIERQVAGVVCTTFKVETRHLQRWTPLSTVGLDSISAIELARKIQQSLGKRVAISTILQSPSIKRLAEALQDGARREPGNAVAVGELLSAELYDAIRAKFDPQVEVERILPCTPLQEAMLAASSGRGSYRNRMLFEIRCDTNKFSEAWRTICRRHGILRTCFASTSDPRYPIVQVVLSNWEAPWVHMRSSPLDTVQVDQCISDIEYFADVPEPIDSMTPTVSFAIISDESKRVFSFACHHALYDGVAMEKVLFEVEQLIKGASLSPPPDYTPFLKGSLALPLTTDRFWQQHLGGLKPRSLSQISVNNPSATSLIASRDADIPLSLIADKTKHLGVSLLSLTQATWAAVLAVSFRDLDVCFGNVVSGRSLPLDRLDELVAPCFNTIPVRMDLGRQHRYIDLIKAFHALNLQLIPYQFTPLRRIQSEFSQRGGQRLFDTLLLLQHPARELDDQVWVLERDEGEMDIPVVCEVIPDATRDRLVVKLHVHQGHLSPEWAELVQDLFSFFLQSCIEFSASQLPDFGSLTPQLKKRLEAFPVEQLAVEPEAEERDPQDAIESESWSATESTIRKVLSTLSKTDVSRIQKHTSIYRLGLDSISAVQIASLLRNDGFQVCASDVIANPTCEGLAQVLDQTTPHSDEESGHGPSFDLKHFREQISPQLQEQGVPLDAIEAVLPCTSMQEGMMAQFIKSRGSDYLNFLPFRLNGHMSGDSLANAWRTLCNVHPILRTGLISVEHERFSFAMLQYHSRDFEAPARVLDRNPGEKFDVDKWRHEASDDILRRTHTHLWNVVILGTDMGCVMHLAIHHALYDAFSLRVLLGDLAKILGGKEIAPRPGNEAALLQILSSGSSLSDGGETFWRQQSDKVVVNRFPVMTPLRETELRILTESTTSSVASKTLEEAVASSGHTLQAALQAAWTRILAAYLGEASVVFDVVLSGRTTEATRDAVFPCITTLPVVSTNVSENRQLLDQMLAYNTELFKQQHQSLARIQQWLGHPNSKLIDTLLVYQKSDQDRRDSLFRTLTDDEKVTVEYPVSIEIEHSKRGTLRYTLTFFSDVLPAEQARLLLTQFDATLCDLVLSPDGNERNLIKKAPEIFSVLPPQQSELPSPVQLLHQFVEAQAAATPDKTALYFVDALDAAGASGRSWTYHDLNAYGNRVANALAPYAKVGDIVAVDFDKCPEAFFSILGILKAGCSFVALDPGAPEARKEFILGDSGAAVLLAAKRDEGSLGKKHPVPVLQIDETFLRSQSSKPPTLCREIQPSDVCYCLYTSGTTGTPKGCEITHDNAVQCMLAFQHIFEGHWDEDSRWLQFASLHFDVSVLEQYWSWSVGITLVAAPRDLLLEDLAGSISKLEITHIDLTPSLARLLHPDDVPSLCRGVFITGGESLKQEILDVWGSKAVIYNFYGPTEATIGVTVFPRVPQNGRASNIGRQFVNVGSYVLKPGTDLPVLKGAVGELCVSGRLVGKGYLNREDLTAERFPTLSGSGERVYRTGDLVRVLHDGCFDFLGRADDQVKLRGQRLEIGEINHAIRTGVEGISDVATVVVRNEQQQKDILVSFLVVDQGGKRAPAAKLAIILTAESSIMCRRVRLACQLKLPGYMVPTYVLQLPFIPLSPNNKAEVKELRGLFNKLSPDELVSMGTSDQSSLGSVSLSKTGRIVAAALSAMKSVNTTIITPSSNIFELGIDSISVLRLSRRLKKAGLVRASPTVVMQHPIVQDLVQVLGATGSSEEARSVANARQLVQACSHRHMTHVCKELGSRPSKIEYIAPCSPLQQGMLSRSGDEGMYFNSFRFKLAPQACAERSRLAWERLVVEHPILRTVFVETVDGCVQVALKKRRIPWMVYDSDGTDAEGTLDAQLARRKREWVARNADGVRTPWEILLVTGLGNGDRILVLHMFHGLYDGNSLDVLMRRVWEEYAVSDASTRRKTPSFFDALCHGPLRDYSGTKPFWVEHLAGWSFSSTRAIIGEPSDGTATSCRRDVEFSDLEQLRTKLAVTHQAILQAAWVSVLAKNLPSTPTIGIITSGRAIGLDGVDEVLGPLFNTLPFLAVPPQEAAWSSLIQACHEYNTATLGFQHVPLRDVQKWCSNGKPLFDSLFSFQREKAQVEKSEWVELESEVVADYPLALEGTLGMDGRLRLLLVSQGERGQLEGLMNELEAALGDMVRTPGRESLSGTVAQLVAQPDGVTDGVVEEGGVFLWTDEARSIREEIALLADVSPELVKESTALFELGLDSIDVVKLAARLKQRGIIVKTSHLIKAQTIAATMGLLSTQTENTKTSSTHQLSSNVDAISAFRKRLAANGHHLESMGTVFPTTPLQDSMVTEMVHSDFQLYFNHDVLEIGPDVNLDRLKEAWETVIDASPILQTTFRPVEDPQLKVAYCQVVRPSSSTHIVVDLDLASVDDIPKVVKSSVARAREGNLESGLLQLVFVNVSGQRFLVLSIAHALYDGWSLGLLHRDVKVAYHGRFVPRPSYESYLHEVISEDDEKATEFWSGFLEGATPSLLPPLATKPDVSEKVVRLEAVSFYPVSDLKAFCKQHAITLQTLGQACWAAIVATRTKSLDVSFGVVLSGRDTSEAEELMFPTMNTVAVRSVLHGTVASWLRYMQDNMAAIAAFQGFPLREAQKLVGGDGGPLFNSLFIQQRGGTVDDDGQGDGESVMTSVGGKSAVDYPVCVEMEVSDVNLIWRIACDRRYASPNDARALLVELDVVLRHILDRPDAEMLAFIGPLISVCGLPVFMPPQPDTMSQPSHGPVGAETWSPVEDTIRRTLSEVSGVTVSSVLKTHNIYHLGLDSISAIKVSSLLKQRGVPLAFRDMLRAKSISEMALMVEDSPSTRVQGVGSSPIEQQLGDLNVGDILAEAGIEATDVEAVFPATAMQVHFLSVWQNTRGRVFYPEFRFQVTGPVDIGTVSSRWNDLVKETPILRTTFVATTSREVPILQVVTKGQMIEHQHYTFVVLRQDGDSCMVNLWIHHAMYDAISLPVLLGRLAGSSMDRRTPRDTTQQDLAWRQFATARLDDSATRARKRFWTDYLRGAPCPSHPPTNSDNDTRVSTYNKSALPDISHLKSACSQRGLSIQAVFFAAYARFLASATTITERENNRARDVIFGIYLANRSDTASEASALMTYPTLALVPLRVHLETADESIMDVAERVQRDLHAISDPVNVAVGLWEIQAWTGVLVDSFVNFLGAASGRQCGEGQEGIGMMELGDGQGEWPAPYSEPAELKGNLVRDAYPDTVDVEVAVRGEEMDIGVFGSRARLGDGSGREVVEGVVDILRGI